jgi:hypothetical protein
MAIVPINKKNRELSEILYSGSENHLRYLARLGTLPLERKKNAAQLIESTIPPWP